MEIEEENYYDEAIYNEDEMDDITEVFRNCDTLEVGRYMDNYQFLFP